MPPSPPTDSHLSKDIAIEFIAYGKAVKVTAINLQTGQEASIVGSTAYSKNYLSQLAVKKLNFLMNQAKNN